MVLLLACSVSLPDGDVLAEAPYSDTPSPPEDTGTWTSPWEDEPEETEDVVPRLLLNEVMTDNASTLQVDGVLVDWIELYNADTVAVPLDQVTLYDRSEHVWMGTGEIAPGAHLLLYADDSRADGHLPFALDADGDTLTLAVNGAVTDRLATGALDADVAWARTPDAGGWEPTTDTTPGAANPDTAAVRDLTDTVFQIDSKHTVDITLSADAYTTLYNDRLNWVEGSVTLDGITYDNVGVRSKAYVGSARSLDAKTGWKIDLNRYGDAEWRGLKNLTLNNMVQDYTYVHEYLVYTLFREAGVPAPRVGYAWVTMNGTSYGLYLFVENIDSQFLGRWYADTSGALYEGAYGVDVQSDEIGSFDYDSGPDTTNRDDLYAVSDILDGPATDEAIAALEELVDLDEFLSNMAVEGVALHWDGYTTSNNYRLYHDPVTDRFQIIPWGADQVFLTQYYDPWGGVGRMFTFCLENFDCSQRYDERLWEVSEIMDSLELDDAATDLEVWLLPEIKDDPRREFDLPTHNYYLDYTVWMIQTYPEAVRAAILAR